MGICISYKGSLREPALVGALVEDLKGLAKRMGWGAWTYDDLVKMGQAQPTGLGGITVQTHKKCEALHLHFDETGRLANHFYHALIHDEERRNEMFGWMSENQRQLEELGLSRNDDGQERAGAAGEEDGEEGLGPEAIGQETGTLDLEQGLRYNWVKTQFGGPAAHVTVCRVLAHVKERYAPDLEVRDDTGYFEHGDLNVLQVKLAETDFLIDRLKAAAGRVAQDGGSSSLAELLAKLQQYFDEAKRELH